MANIVSEDDKTYTLDDGTQIAKAGAPDTVRAMQSGSAIDNLIAGGAGIGDPIAPASPAAIAAPKPITPMGPSSLHIRTDAPAALAAAQAAEAPGAALPGGGGLGPLISLENPITDAELVPADRAMKATSTSGALGPIGLSSSKTERASMDPKAVKKWEKAGDAVATAIDDKAKVESEVAQAKLSEIQSITTERRKFADEEARKQVETDNHIRGKMKIVEEVDNQYLNTTVEAKRFGTDSTPQRIMAAIGIALGSVGSGLNGKENSAIKIINEAIERDIDVQKANMQESGKKAAHYRGALGDYMKASENERAGRERTHANQLDYALAKLDEIVASNADKTIKATANELKMKLQEERDAKIADSTKIVQTNAYEQVQAKQGEVAPGDAWKEVQGLEKQVNALGELKEFAEGSDFAGLGPIESRYEAVAREFGAGDPRAVQLKADINRFIQDRIKTLSGTGSSAAEMERIANTLMKSTDSVETFTSLLNSELDRSRKNAFSTRQSWEAIGQRLPASLMLPKYSGSADQYGATKARK